MKISESLQVNQVDGTRIDRQPVEGAVPSWPFWKMVPRFDREYSFGSLLKAFQSLLQPKEQADFFNNYRSDSGAVHFVRSGRESLYLLLKILGLPEGSRVGVPLYCCASVFEAIAAAGHSPVFLDVDLETYTLNVESVWQKRNELDALVAVHLFGYPAHLEELRSALSRSSIPVIEDCAHALFSTYNGRRVGTCTEASFVTFGMHKPAAAGGGAAMILNDRRYIDRAVCEIKNLGKESWEREIRHSLICWARSLMYQRFAYGALLASPWGSSRDEERKKTVQEAAPENTHWNPAKIRNVDLRLAEDRVPEFQAKLKRLAENTQRLRNALTSSSLFISPEPSYGEWNHFMVPVRYQTKQAKENSRNYLTHRKIDTSPLFQNCARNAKKFGYTGDCPNAELAAQTVCTIPNHVWLKDSEVAYVNESVCQSSRI